MAGSSPEWDLDQLVCGANWGQSPMSKLLVVSSDMDHDERQKQRCEKDPRTKLIQVKVVAWEGDY